MRYSEISGDIIHIKYSHGEDSCIMFPDLYLVTKLDLHTTDEIIVNILEQGKIVTSALDTLKELLQGAF